LNPKFPALSIVAISFTAMLGCSGGSSVRPVSGLFSGSDKEETVLYAVAGGASVFSKASMESRLLGKLDSGERVVKIGETKAFTHIRARGGSMVGWVNTSRLGRKVPPSKAKQAQKPGPPDADVPQSGDAPPEGEPQSSVDSAHSTTSANASTAPAAPAPEQEPTGPQRPSGVGASVFDPY
jgi:hypothetical protein